MVDNKIYTAINKLMKINRQHKRLIDSQVTEIGIHRTQHRILMYLARNGNLPSQKQLADYFEVTPAAITGSLQKLEADGYIQRKLGADNRYNEVFITDAGKEIVERTRKLFAKVDNILFDGFSKDELAVFCQGLDRVINNLKEVDGNEKMV